MTPSYLYRGNLLDVLEDTLLSKLKNHNFIIN